MTSFGIPPSLPGAQLSSGTNVPPWRDPTADDFLRTLSPEERRPILEAELKMRFKGSWDKLSPEQQKNWIDTAERLRFPPPKVATVENGSTSLGAGPLAMGTANTSLTGGMNTHA